MTKLSASLLVALAVLLTVGSLSATGATSVQRSSACHIQFEATVHRGPDTGLSLVGTLAVSMSPSGSLTGALTRKGHAPIVAVGQVQGRAISFVLDLPGAQHLFGVGIARNPIATCRGAIGGVLAGPRPGDSGDWGYGLGG